MGSLKGTARLKPFFLMSDKAFEWGSADFAFQMPDNWPEATNQIDKAESRRRSMERSLPVYQKTNYITRTTGRNIVNARNTIKSLLNEPTTKEPRRKVIVQNKKR